MSSTRIIPALVLLAIGAIAAPARASTEADTLRTTHRAQYERGELVLAIDHAGKEVARRRSEADSLELATALHDLGTYLADDSRNESALACLEESIALRRARLGPDHELLVEPMFALSSVYQRMGDFEAAERAARDAVVIVRKLPDSADPRVLYGLFNLAKLLRFQGEKQDAIDLLNEGLVTLERQPGVSMELIGYRNMLALVYNELLRHEEAARLFRSNVRDCRVLYPDDSVQSLEATDNLALTYGLLRRLESADSLLDQATARAEALRSKGGNVKQTQHIIGHYRGRIANWNGRYDEGERYLQGALERLLAMNYPRGHEQVIRCYTQLGDSPAGRGDFRGAEAYFDSAVAGFEAARLRTGPGTRPATFVNTPYESRTICRVQLNRPEEAWEDIESARGRLLSDSLLGDTVPFALARVRKSLRADEAIVGWLDHELPEGTPRAYAYVIRSTGLVQWVRLPVTPAERVFTRAQRYARFRDAIVDAGYSAFGGDDFPRGDAQQIWNDRLAPLARQLEGVRGLIVIPSDAMSSLPLDALVDESGKFAGERFAIRQAPSASIYAWLCEQSRGVEKTPRSGLLVGDPPFRAEHLAVWTPPATETASRSRVDSSTLRGAVKRDPAALAALPRLPWSRGEIETIAALLPESTTLVGADASRQALTKLAAGGDLGHFDIIHFATHALVDDIKPERSALVLAQVHAAKAAKTPDIGVVTAEEIGHWRLNAELVTLSACETALGRNVFGEGTVGFAYPLLRAGSHCLLASRWPVNDEATALLMGRFYSNWLGANSATRLTKADALRDARMWLRQWRDRSGERPYEHPYYWASFVLVGR